MKRNSKIFIGLVLFLSFTVFSFKFSYDKNGSTFNFVWADMPSIALAISTIAIALFLLRRSSKKEEYYDEKDVLGLKDYENASPSEYDSEDFV